MRPRPVPGAAVAVLAAMALVACTNNPLREPVNTDSPRLARGN
jgi:hypothetical protein